MCEIVETRDFDGLKSNFFSLSSVQSAFVFCCPGPSFQSGEEMFPFEESSPSPLLRLASFNFMN